MAGKPPRKLSYNNSPERMRELNDKKSRQARERRIAELIAKAPPLTADQRSRLVALLNSHPEVAA